MADAMSYEHLIRRIYQVGRFGNSDANADIYRKLERAERTYTLEEENIKNKKPRISNKSIDDLAYEYRVQCRKIWSIVVTAIHKGIGENKGEFTSDEVKEMESTLIEPKVVTKEHIDKAIETAERIYVNHKIYPA